MSDVSVDVLSQLDVEELSALEVAVFNDRNDPAWTVEELTKARVARVVLLDRIDRAKRQYA